MSPWTSAEFDAHEQVCHFTDKRSGLQAIVAIHSTARGAAVGGTRFKAYPSAEHALDDALRLSRAMSYKTALADMPAGGGKAVIWGDPARIKSKALLHAYGDFLNRIGTVFVTGQDVGMTAADIETIREVSPFVGGTATGAGDTAIHTADGLIHGLKAVLERKFGRSDFDGVRLAIQGLGAVGMDLAAKLHAQGARLVVADIDDAAVRKAVGIFGAIVLKSEDIHRAEVDIFSPCALGGGLTPQSAAEIRAAAVAGSANNQLASAEAGEILARRGILYAPDYVVNAGGVISSLEEYFTIPGRQASEAPPLQQRLARIHARLAEIFDRSEIEGTRPEITAETMGKELIGR